jgi:hypothetical protein
VLTENVYGRFRDPSEKELVVIEAYRETYLQAFGVEPAGSHWVDGVGALVSLLRTEGIPDSAMLAEVERVEEA